MTSFTENDKVCADLMLNGSTLQRSDTFRVVYVGDLMARGEVLVNGKWEARTTQRLTEAQITAWIDALHADYIAKIDAQTTERK